MPALFDALIVDEVAVDPLGPGFRWLIHLARKHGHCSGNRDGGGAGAAGAALPSFRPETIRELVSFAKGNPGKVSYDSCGVGTPHHFAMEVLKIRMGMNIQHVSYKSCSPAVQDVVGGQIPLGIATASLIAPYVAAGRLKVLGVSGSKPYPLLPGVPTFESQGLPVQDLSIWYALMGPANMPAQLVHRIASDAGKILDSPAVKTALANAGFEPLRGDCEQLAKKIKLEMEQLPTIAKQGDIQPE